MYQNLGLDQNSCYSFFFFFKKFTFFFIYLFIYFWLCWVFVSVRGLSPVAASGGHSSSRCAGLSLSRPLLLRGTGSRRAGSAIVAHGPSCSAACGILPDQGSNPCPLHRQADSQPLRHQGSPGDFLSFYDNMPKSLQLTFFFLLKTWYCTPNYFSNLHLLKIDNFLLNQAKLTVIPYCHPIPGP